MNSTTDRACEAAPAPVAGSRPPRSRGAVLIEDVERLIEDYCQRIQITPAMQQFLAGMLHHEIDRARGTTHRARHDVAVSMLSHPDRTIGA